jgi:hypothetical protein
MLFIFSGDSLTDRIGIHGQPLVPWDEQSVSKTPGILNGYCTHNSILFPTWHRPYLLLFEVCPRYDYNPNPNLTDRYLLLATHLRDHDPSHHSFVPRGSTR